MSNLFCVQAPAGAPPILLTPSLSRCGVQGVTRERILAIAEQLDIPCRVTELQLTDLQQAKEVFVCNSLIGIWPVRQFQQQDYMPGLVTHRLRVALEQDSGVGA